MQEVYADLMGILQCGVLNISGLMERGLRV